MSIRLTSKVWESELFQEQGTVLVLLALADFSNDEGYSFPSVLTLAKKARMSERNCRRILRRLQGEGILSIEEHRGRHNTNKYRLNLPIVPVKLEIKPAIESTSAEENRPSETQNLPFEARKPATAMAGEPSRTVSRTVNTNSSSATSAEQPVIILPLTGKDLHPVNASEVKEYSQLYPAVDVMQQLRNMRGWLLANERRRKTKRGVKAFIASWLSRAQDKARASPADGHKPLPMDYKTPSQITSEQLDD